MFRLVTTILLSAALGISLAPLPVEATPIFQITATSLYPSDATDFNLTFVDLDGDELFSLDELKSFSGATFDSSTVDSIAKVPDITDISDGGYTFDLLLEPPNDGYVPCWEFPVVGGSPGSYFVAWANTWEYNKSKVPSVPEPNTLILLIMGLVGSAGFRIKQKLRKSQ